MSRHSRSRDPTRRAAAPARRAWRRSATRADALAAGDADRRVGGAPAAGRRGACGAAPGVAGKKSNGAEQRDVDARSDRGDGAARAGEADDRRGRTRARRDRPAIGRGESLADERERIVAELETAQARSARIARRRISSARAELGEGARRARREGRAVPRSLLLELRSDSLAKTRPRGVPVARPLVRQLRHDASDAAAKHHDGSGRARRSAKDAE